MGMTKEPHPKPKAQVPTQSTPTVTQPAMAVQGKLKQKETVAPPPASAVSSTKSATQHQQYSSSQYQQSSQQGSVQQRQPHKYQKQQQQAYYGHTRTPATDAETQDDDDEEEEEDDSEEDSEEETDSDEDDEEDEEEPNPPYNSQSERKKYTRTVTGTASRAGVPSRGLSKGRYDQNFGEETIYTPKRNLKSKPKVKASKVDPYTGYNTTDDHESRIVSRRGRKKHSEQKDITPKATRTILKPKKRVLSEDDAGFGDQKVYLRDTSDDDDNGRGRRTRFQTHGRSKSVYEERDKGIAITKQRRKLDWERKADSAFSVDERIMRRRQGKDDREIWLACGDEDEDDDDDEEEEEEEDTRTKSRRPIIKNGTLRETPERRQAQGQLRSQRSSPQWDIHDLPVNRRAGPTSVTRYTNNYEEEEEEEEEKDLRYRRVHEKEKGRSPISKPANRRGLPQPPAGAGVPEKSMKGGPRWKSTPLKHHDYGDGGDVGGRRKLEMQHHPQEEMTRKFAALGMNDRTSLVDNQGPTGSWPADLPRLPRTPGSLGFGSVTNDGRGYFDMRSQPVSATSTASEFSERQQTGINGKMNFINSNNPPPRATVIQPVSPSPPVLISRREPLPQPPQRPESQTYSTSDAGDRIGERLQRRSLYSAPVQMQEEEGMKKRPQSQIYGSATIQMQASIDSRNQQHQHQQHPSFSNQIMHNSTHYRPQPTPPPPVIGIQSPHPVGGRDKLADIIPMLEEGSNSESEDEHRQRLNQRRVQVPRINVASDPSPPPPPPRIQVDGGPAVPEINVDSSPHLNDGGPIINIEPPRINVNGEDSLRNWKQPHEVDDPPRVQVYEIPGISVSNPEYGGPSINVSEPDDGNPHSHRHIQSVSQQSQFGGQQRHGGQARPPSGLICGGCSGSIIGRIVSAMGSRWHPACFRCTVCNELLEHVSSYEHEGQPYCHLDYHEVRSSKVEKG